jgi:hypothetical protein
MTFNIFAAKRVFRGVQNDRIDDLVSANLRGQKCPAVRKFQVGKFHEPVPCNTPHPFIVHGSESLSRILGFLEGRDGGRNLRGFFAHYSGKQFGPSLVSASAFPRDFIRASRSSASLDICAILRLSVEQTYDSSIDQT